MAKFDMVSCGFQIPEEMSEALEAKLDELDISKVDFLRSVIADAIGYDLTPFVKAKQSAREERKARSEANKKIRAELASLPIATIMKMIEDAKKAAA